MCMHANIPGDTLYLPCTTLVRHSIICCMMLELPSEQSWLMNNSIVMAELSSMFSNTYMSVCRTIYLQSERLLLACDLRTIKHPKKEMVNQTLNLRLQHVPVVEHQEDKYAIREHVECLLLLHRIVQD